MTKTHWVSSLTSPFSLWSAYDPPILGPAPFLGRLPVGPKVHRFILNMLFRISIPWTKPINELRKKHGVAEVHNPFYEGLFSKELILALFSEHFAPKQPDWPPQAETTGFMFYDGAPEELDDKTKTFLNSGDAPIIFTLGSTAVHQPGELYDHFLELTKTLKRRALLLVGSRFVDSYKDHESEDILITDYIAFSKVLHHASCIVHQGGVGTTGQAMLSGKPMLVLPFCNDQFDNAKYVEKTGIGRVLPLARFKVKRAARLVKELIENPTHLQKAQALRQKLLCENGPSKAVDLIEKAFK